MNDGEVGLQGLSECCARVGKGTTGHNDDDDDDEAVVVGLPSSR